MRTKVTLVLLFLNVVLFGYVFYFEQPRTDEYELRRTVLGSEVASLDSFTRTGPDLTIRAEKRGDDWWLTQPYEWPLNPNAFARVYNELQQMRNTTKFRIADLAATNQSLADYGLAQPAIVFTFTSGGKSYELKLGDATKSGNRLYVIGPDNQYIHVVGGSVAESLGLPLAELRSQNIFTIPVFEVRSLGVQNASLKTRLRRDATRWSFETPILARASKPDVEVTVNALNALRARRFYEPRDPAIERAGLDQAALRVTLEGNSRRETLLIGAAAPVPPEAAGEPPADYYFARIEDKNVVFSTAIPADLLERLRAAQEALRDRHVLDFEPRNVSTVTLSGRAGADVSLQRLESAAASEAAESWQIVTRSADGQAPATRPADGALVKALLERLAALNAQRFVSDAPSDADRERFGFNRPERTVSLEFTAASRAADPTGPTGATLVLGTSPESRDVAYALVRNAPYVYQVSSEILRDTPVDPLHYRERTLRRLPAGARLTGLRLTATGRDLPLYERQLAEGETWESVVAAEPEARRAALAALVRGMQVLQAKRFVSESFQPAGVEIDGAPRPWAYRLEATLALVGGTGATQATVSTLHLTPRLGGTTQVAGTDDFGGVTFEINQELVDALFALTYAERDPGPPAAVPAPAPATPPNG